MLQAERGDGSYVKGGTGSYGKREYGGGNKQRGSNGGGKKKESMTSKTPRGLYDMLGIKPGSDRSAVRKAYHALAQKVTRLFRV